MSGCASFEAREGTHHSDYEKAEAQAGKVSLTSDIRDLIEASHRIAKEHGFWDDPLAGVYLTEAQQKYVNELTRGQKIALMHSELSEGLEGIRKPQPDQHCPEFSAEEIELADVLIRVFDYSHAYKLRLLEALFAKMQVNNSRPYRHGKAF